MWIATADGQWLLCEIRGAVFLSWVNRHDKAHAMTFKESDAQQWLRTLQRMVPDIDLVLVKPHA